MYGRVSFQSDQPQKTIPVGYGQFASMSTLNIMRKIINESSKNYYVRRWAESVVAECQKCDFERASSIFVFITSKSKYLHDPHGFEYIKTPPLVLQLIEQGEIALLDCDDFTVLSLSLLKSIGFPVMLRAASYNPEGKLTHVYGLIYIKGTWYPVDCVNPSGGIGWERPGLTKTMDMEV